MNIMKKNVILILTIFLVIIVVIGYGIYNRRASISKSSIENKAYESFYNQQVLGTDVISIINKAVDSNEKNSVQKDEKGNYIENSKN